MIPGIAQPSKEDLDRLRRYLNVHCGKELADVAKKADELNVQFAEFTMKDGSIRSFFCPKLAEVYRKMKKIQDRKKENLAKESANDGMTDQDDATTQQNADEQDVGKE